MSENNTDSGLNIKRIAAYAQAGLIMVFVLYLCWALIGGFDAQFTLMQNKQLASAYADILKSGAANEELLMKILVLLSPYMHWFKIAFLSSILVFPLVGWILGRLVDCEPKWAGILPILGVFSGLNPVRIDGGALLSVFDLKHQIFLLFVQIICVQFCALAAYSRKRKKSKK